MGRVADGPVTARTVLLVFALLVLATGMETSGDAIVRIGLTRSDPGEKAACFVAGALLLFGYGLTLNLAPVEFGRVVGVYIATLFVVWQIANFVAFRALPTLPVMVGGAMIVAGGLVVAFWRATEKT